MTQFQAPAMGWVSPTTAGCPGLHPLLWAPLRMGHPRGLQFIFLSLIVFLMYDIRDSFLLIKSAEMSAWDVS